METPPLPLYLCIGCYQILQSVLKNQNSTYGDLKGWCFCCQQTANHGLQIPAEKGEDVMKAREFIRNLTWEQRRLEELARLGI